jgi:aminoglycoside phosphotransferase (APT) family kinase protein
MVARQEDQARFRRAGGRLMTAGSGAEAVTPVRKGFEFDEAALSRWMARIDGFRGPMTVAQFSGGQSNPTYRLTTPDKTYVLRRKPSGELLKGAHAVEREARVLTALGGAGMPVPKVLGLCTDDRVIGTWFYVMEMVKGRIFWDASLPDLDGKDRTACYDSMNETIARLHSLDPVALGLGDFGRPGNYFERQIARWSAQYLEDEAAGRDPHMDQLIAWLPDNIPPGNATAIVHGDFRIDNLVFHPQESRVIAVFDWELSTLGHPLADFAYHTMSYHMPPHIVAGLAGADLARLNIPSESDYVAAYCRRTGRSGIPDYNFYLTFNFFRLAAIFHGIKGRVIRGTAASAQAAARAQALPELAALAWQQARNVA